MPATVFDKPIFPGAKIVLAELTVTNTSGAYTNTVTDSRISSSMKAYALEIEDPSVFGDKISVTAGVGEYTIECDEVAGETNIKISFLKVLDDPTAITSTEFDVLANRIGDLTELETTVKTDLVSAVNEHNDAIATLEEKITPFMPVLIGSTTAANSFDVDISSWANGTYLIFINGSGSNGALLKKCGSSNSDVFQFYPQHQTADFNFKVTGTTLHVVTLGYYRSAYKIMLYKDV